MSKDQLFDKYHTFDFRLALILFCKYILETFGNTYKLIETNIAYFMIPLARNIVMVRYNIHTYIHLTEYLLFDIQTAQAF